MTPLTHHHNPAQGRDWRGGEGASFNRDVPDAAPLPPTDATPVDYRLSPAFAARLVGAALVVTAVVVFAATAVVGLAGLPLAVLVIVVVLGVVAVLTLGWRLRSTPVVRCDRDGYRVSLVRGAGVTEARWSDVADAATASPRGIPCVVLHLKDGRTTTIPVQALAIDREQFVRELQRHLQRGQGLRPL